MAYKVISLYYVYVDYTFQVSQNLLDNTKVIYLGIKVMVAKLAYYKDNI